MQASQHLGGWDVHAHVVPPAVVAAGEEGRFGMARAADKLTVCAHGIPLYPISEAGRLVERIVSDGLDGAIVSVPPPLFRPDLASSDRRDYAALVNDGLLEACSRHAGTLRPLAYLPAEAPELAAEIAATCDAHWAGVVMGTELGEVSYASPRFDRLWEVLSKSRLPLFIHPGNSPDPRLEPFYLGNLLGNPMETTIAAAHLVFAGVMHRFPSLNIILAHGGGCLAALCGRWQRGAVTRRPGIPDLAQPPIDAVRRFFVDSLVHSSTSLAHIIESLGTDRILLGSDWPFPMGAPHAEHDLGHLDPALRRQIRLMNAQAAFGIRLEAHHRQLT